ncbi:MAG: glycosyltransferase family 2 protein [Chloroflexi bacterium]|nr:glycosyltransferase family 2 protein [Chloroflexota bacterium]
MDASPFLSIVIPAYNEETRIIPSLEKIVAFLREQTYSAEVIVVDDGSTDGTARLVEEFAGKHPIVSLIRANHGGKGHVVRTGMLAARGRTRFMCDADLSMPIEEIGKFFPGLGNEYDIAIGSREAPGAKRIGEPALRHLMGRVFNLIVRLVAVGGFADTQCGFKCFSQKATELVFPLQTMDGWAFDVELLFVARKYGLRIAEMPIDWYYMSSSKVSPARDTYRMFREALSVRVNDWRGQYDCLKS